MLRAAAALEVLHASALAHDDYMDASDTRRGRPATHRAFAEAHRRAGWRGDPEQYGAAAAILLGDLLLSWADELLRRCGLGWDRVEPALALFDRCRSEVITGQFLDVSVQARGSADVDDAMRVLRYKSATYSIERPLHIGAALAGADEATLRALSAFGLPLGEAFQLRDDLLGRLRRPRGDREAGRRRPGRGQAHGAGRSGPGRTRHARTRRTSTARSAPAWTSRTWPGCVGSSTPPVPTPRWRRPSRPSRPGRSRLWTTAPVDPDARAVLRSLATAVTQRVV